MGEVKAKLRAMQLPMPRVAVRIGMPKHRVERILNGLVKNVSDKEIRAIAAIVNLPDDVVRRDIQEASEDTRQEIARSA